jgi:hydroxymethylpyrimidine/phosphomethylpyrimidine kinase
MVKPGEPHPYALTIAGFDPSAGAGVLADSQAFVALGCRPLAVVTSITFQNEAGVLGAVHQTAAVVRQQVAPLLAHQIAAAKTGMLPTREIIVEVARLFGEESLPAPVVDPVMVSSSGHRLMEADAVDALTTLLLPIARLVTPNIAEAETLTGVEIVSEADMRRAAETIRGMGARAVLIKGGHLAGAEAIDVLDNEGALSVLRAERVPDVDVHGTGCMLSAGIAAGLGKQLSLEDAVRGAKEFVLEAIRRRSTK